ncbi:hypothetical protein KCP74_21365 [Salmonella enterica subsp. enterica]|nr:hypothetical protein KCP74_21365 [Salmonella enterica subsp. enterica]
MARAGWLLARGQKPMRGKILLLAFGRKAAREMDEGGVSAGSIRKRLLPVRSTTAAAVYIIQQVVKRSAGCQ